MDGKTALLSPPNFRKNKKTLRMIAMLQLPIMFWILWKLNAPMWCYVVWTIWLILLVIDFCSRIYEMGKEA